MSNTYRTRILIMGAAGRDFHNFNVVYRDDPAFEVVAFTAAQIPGIAGRRYPAALAGALYPGGIAIEPEAALEALIRAHEVELVVAATPIDLAALITLDKPVIRARHEFVDSETPGLAAEIERFLAGLPAR